MALPFPAEWSLAAVPSTVTAVWRGLQPVPASSAIAPQELAKDTIAGAMGSFAFTLVSSFLSSYVKEGCLEVRLPKGKVIAFGQTPYVNGVVPVRLHVHTFAFFKRIAFFHDIGLAEAYMAGDFDVDHPQVLVDLFSLLVRNSASPSVSSQREREGGERGGVKKWVTSLMYAVMCGVGSKMNSVSHHFFHSNSVKNARKNIAAHYDLPPSFFASFLGNTTVYSSALFASPASSLDEAQYAKMDAIIAKARIDKSDTVLEIGGGWGDFAIYCARKTGCKVTAITISQQQYDHAVERIKKEGMEEQVEFKICDYRHVQGVYSRIVSIEMIEAVGHDYLPSFFDTIDRCLAPQGLAVIQAITMPEDRYDAYRKSSDFINKHIFPGGCCPSVRALTIAAKNLTLCEVSEHAPHYARTLREWRSAFLDSEQKIKALGFDDVFIRKWVYYLTYCEAGFKERSIGLHHLVFSRSLNVKALKRAGYDYE
uniref:Cyclopropane-fatty-acyl-phospholipid synthase n=1 Tax=Palpitomonas bilix TaxID=652834 RepID=A0A7S3G9J3_9EUKA